MISVRPAGHPVVCIYMVKTLTLQFSRIEIYPLIPFSDLSLRSQQCQFYLNILHLYLIELKLCTIVDYLKQISISISYF